MSASKYLLKEKFSNYFAEKKTKKIHGMIIFFLTTLIITSLLLEIIIEIPATSTILPSSRNDSSDNYYDKSNDYNNSLNAVVNITDVNQIEGKTIMSGAIVVSSIPSYMVDSRGASSSNIKIKSNSFIDPNNTVISGNRNSFFPFNTFLSKKNFYQNEGFISNVKAKALLNTVSGNERKIPVIQQVLYNGPSGGGISVIYDPLNKGYEVIYSLKSSFIALSICIMFSKILIIIAAIIAAMKVIYSKKMAISANTEQKFEGGEGYFRFWVIVTPLLTFAIQNASPEGNELLYQPFSWDFSYFLAWSVSILMMLLYVIEWLQEHHFQHGLFNISNRDGVKDEI